MYQMVMANSASMRVIFHKEVSVPAGTEGMTVDIPCPVTQSQAPLKDVKRSYVVFVSNPGSIELKGSVLESFPLHVYEPEEYKFSIAAGKDFADEFAGLFAGAKTSLRFVPVSALASAVTICITVVER